MQLGVNCIAPQTLTFIRELILQGRIHFCELMVDNFIHLTPEKIRAALPDIPIALHIVASRFLEKSPTELADMAALMRPWIKALQPLYVSDHLVRFAYAKQQLLPFITEFDYEQDYEHIKNSVMTWQHLLESTVLFENHASITSLGKEQANFFASLIEQTQCGVLFDFSNAYIAEYNHICPMQAWDKLLPLTTHFHAGGFRLDASSGLLLDTHDAPIADEVISRIKKYMAANTQPRSTLVLEFDATVSLHSWQHEIDKLER